MQTLVLKEIRENLKLAALGLVIYSLLLVVQYRDYVTSPASPHQPLAAWDLVYGTMWFCGIFGAVLGWLQIHNERRPDLWAFLLHRPLTRTQIFLAKTFAGLTLSAAVVGLPLLGFILWARWPGHVAAPFELTMLRPLAAGILSGTAFYFAGMLTGLRQVRWYGSRILGLGMALIICLLMLFRPVWWQGFLVILIGTAILMVAVWSAFQTHGYYRGQPAFGKAALSFAVMLGSMIVAIVAASLLSNLFSQRDRSASWSNYVITSDGTVYKVTQGPGGQSEIVDLDGKSLLDAKTRKKVDLAEFNRRMGKEFSVAIGPEDALFPQHWSYADLMLATGWQKTADTLWYYWERYGRLVGYDILTRRCIGSLGPNGFSPDLSGGGDRFSNAAEYRGQNLLATKTTLYRLDLDKPAAKPLFTTSSDDPIRSSLDIRFEVDGSERQYTAVVTRRYVHLLTRDGQPIWKTPYDAQNRAYRWANIYFLEPPGQYVLRMTPNTWENEAAGWKLPVRVVWLARDQGVVKSAELPALPNPFPGPWGEETFGCTVSPPVILYLLPHLRLGSSPKGVPTELLLLNWAGVLLVCLPISLWLGRRYRLPLPAQAGWAVFHLLFGIPGLLAFLSVQEWPARVPCPNCKRLRLVDRQQCEHCGADFAPPEKTGTEVFAPLVASP